MHLKKRIAFTSLALLFSLIHLAANTPLDQALRHTVLLNGLAQLNLTGDENSPPAANASGWQNVRIPTDPAEITMTTSGWYKIKFYIPPMDLSQKRTVLYLDKVVHYTRVLCNGQFCGEKWGFRLPYSVDITDKIIANQHNELMIYVHSAEGKYVRQELPIIDADSIRKAYTRYESKPGIQGDVVLKFYSPIHVEKIHLFTSVRQQKLSAKIWIGNDGISSGDYTVRFKVKELGGVVVDELTATQSVTIFPQSSLSMNYEKTWINPKLWGFGEYGSPQLYFLTVEILQGDTLLVDRYRERFGFREFWLEGTQFKFNGKDFFLVSRFLQTYEGIHSRNFYFHFYNSMNQYNINAIHQHWDRYPRQMLEVADELGMTIVAGLTCMGPPYATWPVYADPDWALWMTNLNRRWVDLDLNHPSIITWRNSDIAPIGAETVIFDSIPNAIRPIDPSRLIISSTDHDQTNGGLSTYNTILSNVIVGVKPFIVSETWIASGTVTDNARWIAGLIYGLFQKGSAGFQVIDFNDVLVGPTVSRNGNNFKVTWPAVSGEGIHSYVTGTTGINWCDPLKPVYIPTALDTALRNAYAQNAGKSAGALAGSRLPEVMVTVQKGNSSVWGKTLYAIYLDSLNPIVIGTKLDNAGKGWLVLPEPGPYRFYYEDSNVIIEAETTLSMAPFTGSPGYGEIVNISLGKDSTSKITEKPKKKNELTKFSIAPIPFSSALNIQFELQAPRAVTLKLYNLTGTEIITLMEPRIRSAGIHHFLWHPAQLQNGIYFLKLESGQAILWNKVIFLK